MTFTFGETPVEYKRKEVKLYEIVGFIYLALTLIQ